MTAQDWKPFYSPKVKLTSSNFDESSKMYKGEVNTTYLWTLKFALEMFDAKKTTANGYVIVGEVIVDGQQIAIFENDFNGNKSWSGTLSRNGEGKGNAWIKVNRVLSADPIHQYEIQITEKPQEETKRHPVEVDKDSNPFS